MPAGSTFNKMYQGNYCVPINIIVKCYMAAKSGLFVKAARTAY